MAEEWRTSSHVCFEENGVLCGYYSLLIQENNVAVLPDYRHKGIGKMLIDHAFNIARELGCNVMNIGIVEENVRLREWYEKGTVVFYISHITS